MVFIEKVFELLKEMLKATVARKIIWVADPEPYLLHANVQDWHISLSGPSSADLPDQRIYFRVSSRRASHDISFGYSSKELYVATTNPVHRELLAQVYRAVHENIGLGKELAVDTIITALKEGKSLMEKCNEV